MYNLFRFVANFPLKSICPFSHNDIHEYKACMVQKYLVSKQNCCLKWKLHWIYFVWDALWQISAGITLIEWRHHDDTIPLKLCVTIDTLFHTNVYGVFWSKKKHSEVFSHQSSSFFSASFSISSLVSGLDFSLGANKFFSWIVHIASSQHASDLS